MPLAVVLAIAIAVRIIYLCIYQSLPDWNLLTVDNYFHYHWASRIAEGNWIGDTTYFRAPGYVWLLGLLYSLIGPSVFAARLLGLVIGIVSVSMTFLIGRRFFSQPVGLIAALIHALYPLAIYFELELLVDPLFTLLLQFACFCWLRWLKSESTIDIVFCGFWLAVSALVRPTSLIFFPILLVLILLNSRKKLASCGAFLLAAVLIIGPVTLRNSIVADDPTLIASNGGINFYIGNNPEADGRSATLPEPLGHNWRIRQVQFIAEQETGRNLTPGEISSYWYARGFDYFKSNPTDALYRYLQKLRYTVANREVSNNRSLDSFFASVSLLGANPLHFGLIFLLAVVGMVFDWKNPLVRQLAGIILLYSLATAIFFFSSRFRLPLLPFYFLLAAAILTKLPTLLQSNRNRLFILFGSLAAGACLTYIPPDIPERAFPPHERMTAGLHAYLAGDYDSAITQYQLARQINPTFPEINLNLGNCYLKLGNGPMAEQSFEREIELHPDRYKGYTNLASLCLVSGQYDDGNTLIAKALALAPYDLDANRVHLRLLAADSLLPDDTLMQEALTAIEQVDDEIRLAVEAGLLLSQRSETAMATQLLLMALNVDAPPIETDDNAFSPLYKNSSAELRTARSTAAFQLGFLAGRQGDYEQAIHYSRRAIELDDSQIEPYINLVSAYTTTGNRSAADSVLSDALGRWPNDPTLRRMKSILTP
jgi:Flp pilus assembly protein TadD/4-amino-4-deoxy-L-arabinose transferase-like glycosyltransferase